MVALETAAPKSFARESPLILEKLGKLRLHIASKRIYNPFFRRRGKPEMAAQEWYYASEGQATGPVSLQELQRLAFFGKIFPDTLVWTEGMANWEPAGTLPQINFGAPPPAPESPGRSTVERPSRPPSAPSAQAGQLRPGPIWRRAVAYLLDLVILFGCNCLASGALGALFGITQGGPLTKNQEESLGILVLWASFFVHLFYFAILESTPLQGSLGKKALRLAVTDAQGERISFWRSLARSFAKNPCTVWVFVLSAPASEDKLCLHDMLARTRVVDTAD